MAARCRQISSTILFFIFLSSRKFSWSANNWNIISFPSDNGAGLANDFRVRKMTTILCQWVIHSVPCSNSYMNGIRRCFLGYQPVLKKFFCKFDRRFINRDRLQPPA